MDAMLPGPARVLTTFEQANAGHFAHALDEAAIVAVTDRRGRIIYCNDRFCEISGYDREELVGANHRMISSGAHDPEVFQDLWATIASGRTWRGTLCNRRKSGELYWVDTTIVPNVDAADRVVGYTAIRVDVTSHVEAMADLALARRQAEAAAEAKDQFIANMGHEVRTPLNGVIGVAGALARLPLDAHQRELVELILSSGHSLKRILDDILDLAKVDAGQLSVVSAPFGLRGEIRSAVELFAAEATNKGVRLDLTFADSADGVMVGDAVRIRQVVANLVSNAVKFTEAGSVDVAVDWRAGPGPSEPGDLLVEVSDTGIGFDPATLDSLFERFVQADDSISRRFGGTGLGLSICKSLVTLMGGEIAAGARPGGGSSFRLRLPLPRVEGQTKDPAEPASPCPAVGPVRVLLAEDHPTNQRVVQLLLEPFGVEVTIAQDGAEAYQRFVSDRFDAILMDMRMPVADGLTATRAIRTAEAERGLPRTPIAMMTANTGEQDRQAALEAGADDFIPKPISAETLAQGLERLLARAA
ncbi:MAG: ATP-binding protein [Phenylobacterium sp.]|uniref:PAS domain-containing hybrid sensor histidine kinase/response regulator n=1 Tax=Phenylobacterium sp. TaxID=1871053 RepID=UPI00391D45A1